MSISSISAGQGAALAALISAPGSAAAGNSAAALTSLAAGSGDGGLIANVEAASSGVSAALQDLSSTLGSVIDTTA
jgi:hypothetical protein